MCDIKSTLLKALKEKKQTDVKFKCLNDESSGNVIVEAHKNILSFASPVFEAMFSPETQKFTVTEEIIEIKDIHTKTFEALISIIYGENNIDICSPRMAFELYFAGEKYDIGEAKAKAKKVIQNFLNSRSNKSRIKNYLDIYELCIPYGNHEVQNICMKYFEDNAEEILKSDAFLSCQPQTLLKIFSLEKLNIKTEYSLVEAFTKYIEKNKKTKNKIIEAVEHIRFLTINPNDLLRIKIFTDKDLLSIIRIAKSYEPESTMPLNLSTSRVSRCTGAISLNRTDAEITDLFEKLNLSKCCIHEQYQGPNCFINPCKYYNTNKYRRFQSVYKKYKHLNFLSYTDEDYKELQNIVSSPI